MHGVSGDWYVTTLVESGAVRALTAVIHVKGDVCCSGGTGVAMPLRGEACAQLAVQPAVCQHPFKRTFFSTWNH
jgi:hypothetical protein